MSEKPKKRGESPVDFVAPYPIDNCLRRIRDTKLLGIDFMTSYEKVESGDCHFKIRRTWYDKRGWLQASDVMLEGYLKEIDETSTMVIAKTHLSMTMPIIIIIITLVLFMVLYVNAPPDSPLEFISFIGAALILLPYGGMIWSHKRSLISLIYHAMSDDLR